MDDLFKYPTYLPSTFGGLMPNEEIPWHSGECTLKFGDKDFVGEASLKYTFTPQQRLTIESTLSGLHTGLNQAGWSGSASLPTFWHGQSFKVERTANSYGDGETRVRCIVPELVVGDQSHFAEVRFHLLNGPEYKGETVSTGKGVVGARCSLSDGEWAFDIDSLKYQRTQEQREDIKRSAGFHVSHVCRLRRIDANQFTHQSAMKVTGELFKFLAFANGGYAGMIQFLAYDDNSNEIGAFDPGYRVSPRPWGRTWLSDRADIDLNAVYQGYLTRYRDTNWQRSIDLAIYWYVAAIQMHGGIEGSLILALSAIQSLAWRYFVTTTGKYSATAFKALNAAPQLREMLVECGIPAQVPSHLTALSQIASNPAFADGVGSIVKIRNCYTHPEPSNDAFLQSLPQDYEYEAWLLALNYLELILLWLFSYNGKYSNRLSTATFLGAEVDKVPWAI